MENHHAQRGTFSGVPTYLGPDVIISPLAMANEAHHLIDVGIADSWPLLKVDKNCLVATPYHSELNRYRETVRGVRRHGSCGEGIGATREHSLACPDQALRAGDLCGDGDGDIVIAKLKEIQAWADGEGRREEGAVAGNRIVDHIDPEDLYHRLMASTWFTVVDKMPNFEMAVFEGAQGVLLDENHGYHPYTTWSTVTLKHAGELLRGEKTDVNIMGCIRPYMTRHGAGTFPSFSQVMTDEFAGRDIGNPDNEWQGSMRYGLLDLNVLAYSKAVLGGQLHSISLSCLDHIEDTIRIKNACVKRVNKIELMRAIEQTLAPISITGEGPCYTDRIMAELSWYPLNESIDV